MLAIVLLLLGSMVSSQMMPMCATPTASQCTVTFTAEGTSQIGPTSTVWATIMTTYLNAVDCHYCNIDNVPYNPSQQGPFTTKITSPMMTVTEVGCMPETTAVTRREFRGYEEVANLEASTTALPQLPHPKRQLSQDKRQNATNPIPVSGLPRQAQLYLIQLNTVLFSIDLVNIGANLNGTCQDLRNGANNTQAASVAINTTQAADFVCAAYAANLTYINPSIVQIFAAALYAVEIAANFTGTTNTTALCDSIDMDILTISMFGVDGHGVQSYVCNANNATPTTSSTVTSSTIIVSMGTNTPVRWSNESFSGTSTFTTNPASASTTTPIGTGNQTVFGTDTQSTTLASAGTITPLGLGNQTVFSTDTSSTTLASAGTITPIGWANDTSFGTVPLATGSDFTGASAGTSNSGLPFSNHTGTRTRSYTGPRTSSFAGTRTRSGSGHWQPTSAGLPWSNPSEDPAQSGSDYDQPTGTDASGSFRGTIAGFPTGLGSDYTRPTGTGVSGWPYGNLTGLPTGSGSGYVQVTATGDSNDPVNTQSSPLEPPSSARLPPNPSTLYYYPAVSPSASPIVFYGYGFQG